MWLNRVPTLGRRVFIIDRYTYSTCVFGPLAAMPCTQPGAVATSAAAVQGIATGPAALVWGLCCGGTRGASARLLQPRGLGCARVLYIGGRGPNWGGHHQARNQHTHERWCLSGSLQGAVGLISCMKNILRENRQPAASSLSGSAEQGRPYGAEGPTQAVRPADCGTWHGMS